MNIPSQYKQGRVGFMDFEFSLNRFNFIPRPETELLVEHTIRVAGEIALAKGHNPLNILDLCTGSGNIAISLTKYVENCRILALDLSLKSLKGAFLNAKKEGVSDRLCFVNSDMFSGLNRNRHFDVIVSNPPYISGSDMQELQTEVKYEPYMALYGGEDGLDYYRTIANEAPCRMTAGGYLVLEIGYDQGQTVPELLGEHGFSDIKVHKDYSSIDRIVEAKWIN